MQLISTARSATRLDPDGGLDDFSSGPSTSVPAPAPTAPPPVPLNFELTVSEFGPESLPTARRLIESIGSRYHARITQWDVFPNAIAGTTPTQSILHGALSVQPDRYHQVRDALRTLDVQI